MRKSFILFHILIFSCVFALPSLAAAQARIKYAQSVYDDGKETGLKHPEGVACGDGYFIAADTGNNRLVKYTFSDKVAKPVEPEMPIISPIAVQVNSKGEIYALDSRDGRIAIFNPDGTEKGHLSPKGSPVARKMMPRNFKIDQNDKIHILDLSDGVVLVLDPDGNYLRHIPLPEEAGFFSDLAVDSQGRILLVDSTDVAVYSAEPDAEGFSLLSEGIGEYANFPTSIALDKGGIIYLVDKHGGSLVMLNPDGSFLGHKFGYGWKESQFYYPTNLCISKRGNFFIADRGNNRIQIFASEEN
ncbi:MAG: NHL repeat-containing protein [Desulfobulbaceae bacterium]|nr:NHL repeat-containing protein [Desulfobulbaceae bacterium]